MLHIAHAAAAPQLSHLTEAVHELASAHTVKEADFLVDDVLK